MMHAMLRRGVPAVLARKRRVRLWHTDRSIHGLAVWFGYRERDSRREAVLACIYGAKQIPELHAVVALVVRVDAGASGAYRNDEDADDLEDADDAEHGRATCLVGA